MILAVFLITFAILGVFSSKGKIPKNDFFDKVKKKSYLFKDLQTYFKYHIYHSYSMDFMILLISFVVLNVLDHFLPFQ